MAGSPDDGRKNQRMADAPECGGGCQACKERDSHDGNAILAVEQGPKRRVHRGKGAVSGKIAEGQDNPVGDALQQGIRSGQCHIETRQHEAVDGLLQPIAGNN